MDRPALAVMAERSTLRLLGSTDRDMTSDSTFIVCGLIASLSACTTLAFPAGTDLIDDGGGNTVGKRDAGASGARVDVPQDDGSSDGESDSDNAPLAPPKADGSSAPIDAGSPGSKVEAGTPPVAPKVDAGKQAPATPESTSDAGNVQCSAGFDGERCAHNIDDCASSPCANSATCIDGVDTYTCKCADGYSATADQRGCTQIDDCVGAGCGVGGVCIDGTSTYSCMCSSGYSGTGTKSCVNINDCGAVNPCTPEGICIDGVNSFSCECNGPVPDGVPANSCRFTAKGDGVFDAQTGLSWSYMIFEISKSDDTPTAGCQRQGEGRRPPTAAEYRNVVEFEHFNQLPIGAVGLCFATTTVDVCGRGATTQGQTHGLRCVR
jgi:hypothetical protein